MWMMDTILTIIPWFHTTSGPHYPGVPNMDRWCPPIRPLSNPIDTCSPRQDNPESPQGCSKNEIYQKSLKAKHFPIEDTKISTQLLNRCSFFNLFSWLICILIFPQTPMMTIFRAILSHATIAKMVKMAIMTVMEWHNMATNMAVIGVYGKSRINTDSP